MREDDKGNKKICKTIGQPEMKMDEEEMKAKKLYDLEQIYEDLNKRKISMMTPNEYNIQNSKQEKKISLLRIKK